MLGFLSVGVYNGYRIDHGLGEMPWWEVGLFGVGSGVVAGGGVFLLPLFEDMDDPPGPGPQGFPVQFPDE